ncbi:T9SS type A sorting domain-containing protein [Balneola sp. MJW-20]|uniref:T9SS type A sorting domain-containing protein n=1 Tax=Gracilimonas aurantiaca TaxID=3234185 RepID=UPI0034671005
MKSFFLTIVAFALSSVATAQINPINFEADGNGADWSWTVFENGDNPPVDVIFNPDATGANTSDSVAAITVRAEGASFAGATTRDIGSFTLDETNRTIKIMVWKSKISDVGIKLETASGFAYPEVKVANTVTNEWEELTFDFSNVDNPPSEPWNGITIFPDFGERSEDATIYFDNITFSEVQDNGGPQGELVTNGDFEAGNDGSWYGNALDIRTENGNSFNFADVQSAGEAFSVNLSQIVELSPGESYTLTFDASTSEGNSRDMVVGIGQSDAPFYAATETVTLADTNRTYTIDLVATDDGTGNDFGSASSRVLFDMGADVGIVVIDNVSLEASVATSNENDDELPSEYVLNQNYPNPFNPTTNISFSLPQPEQVSIRVYDMLGREVATLVNQQRFGAGSHEVNFNASNLSSGIYIYRLQAGSTSFTRKMTLIK